MISTSSSLGVENPPYSIKRNCPEKGLTMKWWNGGASHLCKVSRFVSETSE
jgi:hypothetical protein